MTKSNTCLFAIILCLIPENVKIPGNGLAGGCQLFYRNIYGYFMQRMVSQNSESQNARFVDFKRG